MIKYIAIVKFLGDKIADKGEGLGHVVCRPVCTDYHRYLYTCSKNDVISSVRKRYCTLGLGLELVLVQIRFQSKVSSIKCSRSVTLRYKEYSWSCQLFTPLWSTFANSSRHFEVHFIFVYIL